MDASLGAFLAIPLCKVMVVQQQQLVWNRLYGAVPADCQFINAQQRKLFNKGNILLPSFDFM